MNASKRLIEIDERTAIALEERAADCGVSVPKLVAEMTSHAAAPRAASADEIAELDRRWSAIKRGEPTVPNDEVVRWLRSWGSPAYKPGLTGEA